MISISYNYVGNWKEWLYIVTRDTTKEIRTCIIVNGDGRFFLRYRVLDFSSYSIIKACN